MRILVLSFQFFSLENWHGNLSSEGKDYQYSGLMYNWVCDDSLNTACWALWFFSSFYIYFCFHTFISTRASFLCLHTRGHLGIVWSVCLSVPWRSCLGYRHAGCLQLSHRQPPEMRGLRTRPRTDVDPLRFCHRRTAIGLRHVVSPPPGWYLVMLVHLVHFLYV